MDIEKNAPMAQSFERFSCELYKNAIAEYPDENIIISPISAQIALALLSMGSEGKTMEELSGVLGLSDREIIKSEYMTAIEMLKRPEDLNSSLQSEHLRTPPILEIVNKVYVKNGCDLSPGFESAAKDAFESEVEVMDFAQSDRAASAVNSWVENKTNKRISNLVTEKDLNSGTSIVLVNALYFKAAWLIRFFDDETKEDDFFLGNGEKAKVEMMTTTCFFSSTDIPEWKARVIKLPFETSDLSMVIVVPDDPEGLASLESKIASQGLAVVLARLLTDNTALTMPKFRIESTVDLKRILPKLGVEKIFKEEAELDGVLNGPSNRALFVSEAVQKAYIEIDENGCEAAAATGMHAVAICRPITFKINVPFYYAVINERGARIFNGRFLRPC